MYVEIVPEENILSLLRLRECYGRAAAVFDDDGCEKIA